MGGQIMYGFVGSYKDFGFNPEEDGESLEGY